MICKVRLNEELYEYYKKIELELQSGNKVNEREYKLISKGIELLKLDFRKGEHISKKNQRAYEYFVKKYNVKNLWKLDVSQDWRLIYTIEGNEVEVISFVLESLSHKEYERKLGYH